MMFSTESRNVYQLNNANLKYYSRIKKEVSCQTKFNHILNQKKYNISLQEIIHILQSVPYDQSKILFTKEQKHLTTKNWTNYLNTVLNIYNNKNIHSSTGYTPNYARLAKYRNKVLFNLEQNRKLNKKYPTINVGDKVRIFKKKDKMTKERVPRWSPELYTVEKIIDDDNQKLYKLIHIPNIYIRSEILLVK